MDWSLIPVVSYVFFGLFVVSGLVHLVFCYFEMELARKISKCPTTFFLFAAAVFAIPTEPLVYLGMLFGVIGDLCLLKKHKVWPFVCGMLAFLVNHILYIAAFMKICGPLHYSYYLATGLYVILFPIVFYRVANKIIHQKHIAAGGALYAALLSLDLIWAIITCAHGHVDFILLAAFGAAVFIISDAFLTRTLFKKDVKRRDFYIMLTYLIAQGLMITGFVMTLIR